MPNTLTCAPVVTGMASTDRILWLLSPWTVGWDGSRPLARRARKAPSVASTLLLDGTWRSDRVFELCCCIFTKPYPHIKTVGNHNLVLLPYQSLGQRPQV